MGCASAPHTHHRTPLIVSNMASAAASTSNEVRPSTKRRCTRTEQQLQEDEQWRNDVKQFIMDSYVVICGRITSDTICAVFNSHVTKGYLPSWIPLSSWRHVFSRKKGVRPPTNVMRHNFERLKELKKRGHLFEFWPVEMPLRDEPWQ